jgi:hypothetical protein
MAATFVSIRDAIKSAIAANHTAGGGTYDLSATDQVKIGRFLAPPGSVAFVNIASPTIVGAPDARTLRDHAYVATFDVRGWVPVASDTPEARSTAALNLMSDIAKAVKDARYNTGGSLKAINAVRGIQAISLVELDGEEFDIPSGWASCFASVVLDVHLDRGL